MKADTSKTKWGLLPWDALKVVVHVFMSGNNKEGRKPNDWKANPDSDIYFDATMRHLTSWVTGERVDPESGRSHLAHAICCLLIMLWGEIHGKN